MKLKAGCGLARWRSLYDAKTHFSISHKLLPVCAARRPLALNREGRCVIECDRHRPCTTSRDWFLKTFRRSGIGAVCFGVGSGDGRDGAASESNVICEYIEDSQDGAKLHPQDPLQRAQHRAWMEFGSTILSELWGSRNHRRSRHLRKQTGRDRGEICACRTGPWNQARSSPGEAFSLVDAVFAPIFRYFDVFRYADRSFDLR